MAPRRLIERSDALVPQRRNVQFKDKAKVVDEEEQRYTSVKFGPKDKPVRIGALKAPQSTLAPEAAPAPKPPNSPVRPDPAEQHESMRARFRGLFRSKGHAADKPVSNSPPKRAQTNRAGSERHPERTQMQHKPAAHQREPGQLRINHWHDLLDKLPDVKLAEKLRVNVSGAPSARQLTKDAANALSEVKDKVSFSLLLEMIASVNHIAPSVHVQAVKQRTPEELQKSFDDRWVDIHYSNNFVPEVKKTLTSALKQSIKQKDGGKDFIKSAGLAMTQVNDKQSLAMLLSALNALNEIAPRARLATHPRIKIGEEASTPRWGGQAT